MSKPTTTQERAAKHYADALNRHTSLLGAFERALRITDELYQRLERDMWAGLNRASPEDPTKGFYNPGHARDAVALSRALAQAGAVHARLLENESARADNMSDEDKLEFMRQAINKKPPAIRLQFIDRLKRDLDAETR